MLRKILNSMVPGRSEKTPNFGTMSDIRSFERDGNHLDPDAGWGTDEDGEGCLFEIHGEEFEFVAKQDPATVWTWVDGENGPLLLGGLHYCNRIGYLVSTKPRPANTWVVVRLYGLPDDPKADH